ncbi:hypothetical protein BTI45_05960 [Lactobacillus delbrueckii subsp. bulgaricus]|nr:hypothetical protein [Lactobacillus delbrueckii subsp. bulgaricus]
MLTILRRIHVKNRKLEKIVTIVEQVLADYVALYRRIGFSDQEKQNIINSMMCPPKLGQFSITPLRLLKHDSDIQSGSCFFVLS